LVRLETVSRLRRRDRDHIPGHTPLLMLLAHLDYGEDAKSSEWCYLRHLCNVKRHLTALEQ